MTASCDHLIDILRDSNLLSKDQYAHLIRELVPTFQDPEALAAHLIRIGWITRFQLDRLNSENWRELFLGDYFLWDVIGEGGMGVVYRGRHIIDRREVAIKVISEDRMDDKLAVKRFSREARMTAKLDHPNIVTLIETGWEGARKYIVMEYVQGLDLQRLVERDGPLMVHEACEYIRQAAEGLQHAHNQKMVHRDIKPSNILISNRSPGKPGLAKVLDMGLARNQMDLESDEGSMQTALTRDGAVLGTADYMAPEQAVNSSSVDHRADIYSLGCTLYFLLAGRPVFQEGSPLEKLMQHQMDEPKNIRQLRPEVSSELSRALHRSIAKRPENRIQTCAEFARLLQPWCDPGKVTETPEMIQTHLSRSGTPYGIEVPPASAREPAMAEPISFSENPAKSGKKWIALAVFLVLLGVCAAAAFFVKQK